MAKNSKSYAVQSGSSIWYPQPSTTKDSHQSATYAGKRPMASQRRMDSSEITDAQERDRDLRRAIVLRDYHDQPFSERNYGAIRGLFESPSRKILRHEGIAFIGEFLGTFGFLFGGMMIGQMASLQPRGKTPFVDDIDKARLVMIAFGFGLSLMANVFIWFRVTGGQFNPAVSLGLCVMGAIKPGRLVTCVVAQITGGILAAFAVDMLTDGPLLVTNGLASTGYSTTSALQGFFIEMLGTMQLVLVIFFMAVEKHRATPMAPLVIGLTLVMIHLMAINSTGSAVNPARAFGPAVVAGKFKHLWIYLIAPLIGALLAAAIFAFIKWAGYQDVNPGQDAHKASDAEYVLPHDKRQQDREHILSPSASDFL